MSSNVLSSLHLFININPWKSSGVLTKILILKTKKQSLFNDLYQRFKTSEGLKGFEMETR